MTNASRAPVDFDAFERELQAPSAQPQARAPGQVSPQAKADPLAELARIVGQDDPFRALLEARDARGGATQRAATARGGRVEPTFFDEAPPHPAGEAVYGAPHSASPADAFNQYLASVEQSAYPETHADDGRHRPDEGDFAQDGADERPRAVDPPRGRSRLVSVGAGLAVLVVAVTGALTWRGLTSDGSGDGPITVMADKTPLKVAPQAADGVEIPDQNKQIYERNAKDGQIKVVNREEQPLDVAQAARAAGRGGSPANGTPGSATPNVQHATLTESLGEPRRVRTVAVKPDTPVPSQPREVPVETATPSPIPTMTMPVPSGDRAATTASVSPQTRLARAPAQAPVPAPEPVTTASAPSAAEAVPAPAPAPRVKEPQRVASVSPESLAPLSEAPVTTTASTAPLGGFSVQLGVRTSEREAQVAFKQMQAKYSQLSGQPELIRQAEVNGKTIYRVRVGPLGKAEATSLCTKLQGAGGQCFVAKN